MCFVFLELDECLMVGIFLARGMGNQMPRTYEEHQNIEDIIKMILKECEDKDVYKGGGFV